MSRYLNCGPKAQCFVDSLPTRMIKVGSHRLINSASLGWQAAMDSGAGSPFSPDKPVSDKPPESRMGGGKGDIVDYVSVVRPGRIIFEMDGVTPNIARQAMKLASDKLNVKTRIEER